MNKSHTLTKNIVAMIVTMLLATTLAIMAPTTTMAQDIDAYATTVVEEEKARPSRRGGGTGEAGTAEWAGETGATEWTSEEASESKEKGTCRGGNGSADLTDEERQAKAIERIDQAVIDGKMTQEEANELKEQINNGEMPERSGKRGGKGQRTSQ